MTPSEIETMARDLYNASSDTFFSQSEILKYLYAACMQLATKALVIERVYTASTVADTQEYSWPTNAIGIKRITYAGQKLQPINFREDDQLTLNNQATTSTGTPHYYALWNRTFYLRPTPSAVGTLKIFTYNQPQSISITSTLEIPEMFHLDTVDYIIHRMAAKDGEKDVSKFYLELWLDHLAKAKAWKKKQKYSDGYPVVQNEEVNSVTLLGAI